MWDRGVCVAPKHNTVSSRRYATCFKTCSAAAYLCSQAVPHIFGGLPVPLQAAHPCPSKKILSISVHR